MFDVITPVGPHDLERIDEQLAHTRENVEGVQTIWVVTRQDFGIRCRSGVQIVDEADFPFYAEVPRFLGENDRNGWYLQQLIKLYAGYAIRGCYPRWLAIDADTHFLKPTSFISGNAAWFTLNKDHHAPYFRHMKKLHPSLQRQRPGMSGIVHHMMFWRPCVGNLLNLVESHHKKPFWQVFLECIDPAEREGAGASEYEIYFNFMLKYHPDLIKLRGLKWNNVADLDAEDPYDCDFLSNHHHMRSQK